MATEKDKKNEPDRTKWAILFVTLLVAVASLMLRTPANHETDATDQDGRRIAARAAREEWTERGKLSREIIRSEEDIVTVSGPSDLVAELVLENPLTGKLYSETAPYPNGIELPPNWKKVRFRSDTVWLKIVTRPRKAN